MRERDYDLIAEVISGLNLTREDREHVAWEFVVALSVSDRFDQERFLAAARKE